MCTTTSTLAHEQYLPLVQQAKRRDFLHSSVKERVVHELEKRGIKDYSLIVKVDLGVVDADNISDLAKFHAEDDADPAARVSELERRLGASEQANAELQAANSILSASNTTIADVRTQLKVREQANAKLKRANSTLSATNKDLVRKLRSVEEEHSSTRAVDEVALQGQSPASDQAGHDADPTTGHGSQADPFLDLSRPDSHIKRDPPDLEQKPCGSEATTSVTQPSTESCAPTANEYAGVASRDPALIPATTDRHSQEEEDLESTSENFDSDSVALSLQEHVYDSLETAQPLATNNAASGIPADTAIPVLNPTGRIRCAFMVTSATKTMAPIGDPFHIMNGWAVDMEVHASRHGTPYLTLHFRINKGRKNRPVSDKHDQCITFEATWRVGDSMIPPFKMSSVSGSLLLELTEHALVAGKCPAEAPEKLSKLVAINFNSSDFDRTEYSAVERKPWKHLSEDVQHGLDCLMLGEGHGTVTIWFCAEPSPQAAGDMWIRALQGAVQNR